MKTSLKTTLMISILFLFVLGPLELIAQGKGKAKQQNKEIKGNKNKPGPPSWAPAHGYRAKTRYVYFTEHNLYYDFERAVYLTLSGGRWTIAAKLPNAFKEVDLAIATKVAVDYSGKDPYKNNAQHKKMKPKK